MCKISEKTILRANERMKTYKIGKSHKIGKSGSFTVATNVHGKVYHHTFTEEGINTMFGHALKNMELRHGKAL